MRVNVTLACTDCGERNYISKKNKRNNPERIEMKNIVLVTVNTLFIEKQNNKTNKNTFHYTGMCF